MRDIDALSNTIKDKLLTLIIPVYNTEIYLERCLDSIISQKYKCLQIVLVDDGSSDNSACICDCYSRKDNRVSVIHTKNSGSVAARKRGLLEAKGDYVCFVDSDDYVDIDMYSTLVSVMDETDSDFVHSGYKEIYEKKIVEKSKFPYKSFDFDVTNDRLDFLRKYFLDIKSERTLSYSMWSKIYKKELIEKCFMELDNEQQLGEDALCLCRCIMESRRATIIPDCKYNYVVRNESLSHKTDGFGFINHIMLSAMLIKIMKQYGIDMLLKNEMIEFCKSTILPFVKPNEKEQEYIKQFYLEDISLLKGRRIVLYGGGKVGRDIFAQIASEGDVDLVCWADRKYTGNVVEKGEVLVNPQSIKNYEYDIVYIAIADEDIADNIRAELLALGIDNTKVVWSKPNRFF